MLEVQGKATAVPDDAQGVGIQVGFKVFHQLLLQLDLDFKIQALEGLVALEAVDAAILDEVATSQEGTTNDEIVGEEATQLATVEGTFSTTGEDAGAKEVLEGEEAG